MPVSSRARRCCASAAEAPVEERPIDTRFSGSLDTSRPFGRRRCWPLRGPTPLRQQADLQAALDDLFGERVDPGELRWHPARNTATR